WAETQGIKELVPALRCQQRGLFADIVVEVPPAFKEPDDHHGDPGRIGGFQDVEQSAVGEDIVQVANGAAQIRGGVQDIESQDDVEVPIISAVLNLRSLVDVQHAEGHE